MAIKLEFESETEGLEGESCRRQANENLAKNLGMLSRPSGFLTVVLVSAFSFSLQLSSWLPFDLFSLSIFHGLCNGELLQLIECIESIKTEVKKKIPL